MKKNFNKFFIALALFGLSAGAYAQTSGMCGTNLTWALTGVSPNYTLTIVGTGDMTLYHSRWNYIIDF